MRISDCSSDVCSSDLRSVEQFESATEPAKLAFLVRHQKPLKMLGHDRQTRQFRASVTRCFIPPVFELFKNMRDLQCLHAARSEEHTSELQSLMRISYAVFCLKKNKQNK